MSELVDLDDTSRCPRTNACDGCGGTADLDTTTVLTPIGVYCTTLCDRCVEANHLPRLGWSTAANAIAEHCGHLGIDLDQMAAALAAERGER